MTNKQYVIRAAKMLKVDIIAPTRACPGILGTAWVNGYGKNVVDAQNWDQARDQINAFARQRAA